MGFHEAIERWFDTMEALTQKQLWVMAGSLRGPEVAAFLWCSIGPGQLPLQAYPKPKSVTFWGVVEGVSGVVVWVMLYTFIWLSLNWCWPWIPYCQATSSFIASRWWLRYSWYNSKDSFLFPEVWSISITLLRYAYERLYLGLLYVLAFALPTWDVCVKFVISDYRQRLERIGLGRHTEFTDRSSGLDPYFYRSLIGQRDIRLLQWPRRTVFGRDEEPTLVHCALGEEKYDCISYVWGTEAKDSHIIVDGQRLAVTATIPKILNSLRSVLRERKLWIDAVCINQVEGLGHNHEKTHQVRMMADIYSHARKVIIWLGDDMMIRGVDASTLLKELRWIAKNYHRRPYYAARQRLASFYYHSRWQALSALLRHPWFERVWTIQEAAVASEIVIYYSGVLIPWQVLVDVDDFLNTLPPSESLHTLLHVSEGRDWIDTRWWGHLRSQPEGFRRVYFIESLREKRDAGEEPRTYRDMLRLMHHAKSKHPRDMLYAIQSLTAYEKSGILLPDYSITDDEVFIRAARYFLSLESPLDILAYAGLCKGRSSTLPSWVPDLGRLPQSPTFMMPFDGPMRYAASGKSFGKAHLLSDYRVLTVSGTIIDKIDLVGPTIDCIQPKEGIDMAEYYLHLADTFDEAKKLYLHDRPFLARLLYDDPKHWAYFASEPIWRTMAGDRDILHKLQPLPREYIEEGIAWELHWQELREFLREHPEVQNDREALKQQLVASRGYNEPQCLREYRQLMADSQMNPRLLQAIGNTAHGRRFCVTRSGCLGLVPEAAEVGDSVAVLMGAQTPFIVRRASNKAATQNSTFSEPMSYRLVGECYIDGAMHGEMLQNAGSTQDIRLV